MIRGNNTPKHIFAPQPTADSPVLPPKRNYTAAVKEIVSALHSDVDVVFDSAGAIRTLSADSLFAGSFTGNARQYAQQYLAQTETVRALGLRYANLVDGETSEFPAFTRVEFRQVVRVAGLDQEVPVRGGYVHVFVDADGKIFNVNSTIRRGARPRSLAHLISKDAAIASAKAKLALDVCEVGRCELVLSAHDGRLDPVYEILLTVCKPRTQRLFLVKAKSGEVVYEENRLYFAPATTGRKRRTPAKGVPAKSFLRIPDYASDQVVVKKAHDVLIELLPNAKVLANERYDMKVLVNGDWQTIEARSDGTFNFDPLSKDKVEVSKFSAVVTFLWLNTQDVIYEGLGGVKVPHAIPVFMDDPSVEDNAYFDPEAWEIHMGIGTGVKKGGLAVHIAWDPGVGCHENGHKRVAAQTPGHDLPGQEGAGAHEAYGDTLGDLYVDFKFRLMYAKVLGATLSAADVIDDPRIVGKYCLPPDGIRIQKNTKKTPKDKTGEPHDDGLIIGGALADLMVAMATVPGIEVEQGLDNWAKLQLNTLALVPAHKVLWTDLLRASLTADKKLFAGVNQPLIVKAYGDHGIKLSSPRKGKGKGKGTGKGHTGSGKGTDTGKGRTGGGKSHPKAA